MFLIVTHLVTVVRLTVKCMAVRDSMTCLISAISPGTLVLGTKSAAPNCRGGGVIGVIGVIGSAIDGGKGYGVSGDDCRELEI